jgi:hypothetical protein
MISIGGCFLLWIRHITEFALRRCTRRDAACLVTDCYFFLLFFRVADNVIGGTFVAIATGGAASLVRQLSHMVVCRMHPKASFAVEELASHLATFAI